MQICEKPDSYRIDLKTQGVGCRPWPGLAGWGPVGHSGRALQLPSPVHTLNRVCRALAQLCCEVASSTPSSEPCPCCQIWHVRVARWPQDWLLSSSSPAEWGGWLCTRGHGPLQTEWVGPSRPRRPCGLMDEWPGARVLISIFGSLDDPCFNSRKLIQHTQHGMEPRQHSFTT